MKLKFLNKKGAEAATHTTIINIATYNN